VNIPDSIIRQVAEKTDILEVVGHYTSLQKMGNRYRGLCPFHQERTPSFYVQPEKGLFYCFGCNKGGNVFQFIMEIEHFSFPEAVRYLGEKCGIAVVDTWEETAPETVKRNGALIDLLHRVAKSFHYILMETPTGNSAVQYLHDRGLEDSIIKKFLLGYSPPDPLWLKRFLQGKNYSSDFLQHTGLFSAKNPNRSFFTGRIMFPIYSLQGEIVAFGGRILQGQGPKYLNSPESSLFKKGETLYGFFHAKEAIRKARSVVLAEGYMDVLALHQAGIETAVAPLGTAFTSIQARLIRRFADQVILFFDQDTAGIQAVRRAAILCEQAELEVRVADAGQFPYKDPAEFIQNQQKDELQKIVKYSIPILEFLLQKSARDGNKEGLQEKQLKVWDLFPYIESVTSEVKRDNAISQIAEYFQIDRESVRKDFLKKRWIAQERKEEQGEKQKETIQRTPELILMIIALESRRIFEEVRSRVSLEDFVDPRGRELFISLEEMYRQEGWEPHKVLESIQDETLRTFVLSKFMTEEFKLNQDKLIRDSVIFLKRRNLENQRKNVIKEIRVCQQTGQEEALTELLEKKMYLDGELLKLRVVEDE
jgi:DNA primase